MTETPRPPDADKDVAADEADVAFDETEDTAGETPEPGEGKSVEEIVEERSKEQTEHQRQQEAADSGN